MKLRDLGPGMAVHCQTEEQAKEYCRQLKLAGLCDFATYYFPFRKYGSELCFLIGLSQSVRTTYSEYANLEYVQEEKLDIVEFDDLEFDVPAEPEETEKKYIDADELLTDIDELLRSPWANDNTPVPKGMAVRDALGIMQSTIRSRAGMKLSNLAI